jgi:formylglycine-generating enzyme required for sulfatase activity
MNTLIPLPSGSSGLLTVCILVPALIFISSPALSAEAGDEIVNAIGMKFRLLPAGSFAMGSPENEANRNSDETQRTITLTKPFHLGVTEITQAQWLAVMDTRPSDFEGANLPVEQVSYDDATEFCKKLSATNPKWDYRLPTEAEWEYACRAGTTTAYYWGDASPDDYAWHEGNSDEKTHPIATKKPNAWGLYDMSGNVWEWCLDMFGAYPMDQKTDPTGTTFGILNVRRGGCWYMPIHRARSAYRYADGAFCRYNRMGFRVVALPKKK